MADTFSNDLRLRLQESGSNAGTWGDLLNGTITNIASGFGQGSEAIPNASTHTITLADGAADEARSLYLKCTGGGQACTVTLGPNTISKVWIIDNATSYTLTFSQGSGANVAIAAGAVKVIATDGAGSGAAVVDTLDGLEGSFSTLAVTGAVTADGLTVDGAATIDGGATDNTVLTLDSGTANTYLKITDSNSTNGAFIGATTNDLNFYPNNSLAVTMAASGNVGIGKTPLGNNLSPALEMVSGGTMFGYGDAMYLTGNLYYNGGWKAIATGAGASMVLDATGPKFYTNASASAGGTVTPTERMRLDQSGNLALMTDGAEIKLYYTEPRKFISNSGPSVTIKQIDNDVNNAYIDFASWTNSSLMRLMNSGNLLVGTTSNIINANARATFIGAEGLRAQATLGGGSSCIGAFATSGGGTYYYVGYDLSASAIKFQVLFNGNVQNTNNSYGAISDAKLKENVTDATPKLEKLNQVRVVNFNLIGNEQKQIGVIAQELEQIFPSIVEDTPDFDAEGNELGTTTKSVKYSVFVPMLIKAMQEQQATIEALTQRIETLENK